MALTNCEDAKKRFEQKLAGGFYSQERSTNTEVNYTEEKQARDTQAVERFAQEGFFQALYANLQGVKQ